MKLVASSIALAALFFANSVFAHGPYVVIHDDGTLNGTVGGTPAGIAKKIAPAYTKAGGTMPDIISVWTNFSMDKNDVETLFIPVGNDVTGIGLETQYGGTGIMKSAYAPLRSILLHNNVTALAQRAAEQNAPIQDFAQYIFLLELSHTWGPAIQLPAEPDGGAGSPGELIGFPFHWSFFFDPGGLAGGNPWTDNGGGSFSISGQSPSTIKYSPIDLYIMGLADKSDVTPFGSIENAVVPATVKDPFTGKAYSGQSFPWWGTTPFTVTGASRRTITIDDVIAANGARSPDFASSPKAFTLGVVLDVAADASDDDIAAAEAALDPVAASLPAAFAKATGGRGTMTLVTLSDDATSDAGPSDDAGANSEAGATSTSSDSGGCNVPGTSASSATGWSLGVGAFFACAVAFARRRRRNRHAASDR